MGKKKKKAGERTVTRVKPSFIFLTFFLVFDVEIVAVADRFRKEKFGTNTSSGLTLGVLIVALNLDSRSGAG